MIRHHHLSQNKPSIKTQPWKLPFHRWYHRKIAITVTDPPPSFTNFRHVLASKTTTNQLLSTSLTFLASYHCRLTHRSPEINTTTNPPPSSRNFGQNTATIILTDPKSFRSAHPCPNFRSPSRITLYFAYSQFWPSSFIYIIITFLFFDFSKKNQTNTKRYLN